MTTDEYFAWLRTDDGGRCVFCKDLGDGVYAAVKPLMFHWTMIVGEIGDQCTIADRFCYDEHPLKAVAALAAWDGNGDPEGWQRHPATGRRRPDGDPTREYIEW